MKIMTLSSAYSWIFLIIVLNHGIIRVSSFPISIEGLAEFGFDLLLDYVLGNEDEEGEDVTMTDIASKIDDIENSVKDSATNVINEVGHILKYEQAMQTFTRDVSYILTLYDWFKRFSNGSETKTLLDYADVCLTSADIGLTHRLNSIMHLISPDPESEVTPLFELIIEPYLDERAAGKDILVRSIENNSLMLQEKAAARCDKLLSVQQEIYRMYGEVTLYLIKGYSMIFNAYEIKKKLTHRPFKQERKNTKRSYKKVMREITRSALAAMVDAPRDIRGCDPEFWEEGISYIELKWVFNRYFIPEYQLSEWSSCKSDCKSFSGIKGLSAYNRQTDTQWPPCRGFLYDCSDSSMHYACAGQAKEGRFYDAVGGVGEDLGECDKNELVPEHVENSARASSWQLYQCLMCSCTCDSTAEENTIRHFNLKLVQSRTSENKVITGLRLVVMRQCVYIQIQEGKLEPNGYINKSTVGWQPVQINTSRQKWRVTLKSKTIKLGTINFPTGYVMTAVRFKRDFDALELEVMVNKFDYSSGILTGVHVWKCLPKIKTITNRKLIEITAPDIPTKAKSENIVTLEDNWFVDFRMTDMEKDIGQTTVPFFDAQVVESVPPRPLSGLGLYYRGQEGYGGFIAFKLVAYDYAKVLAKKGASIPEIQPDALEEADTEGKSPREHRGERYRKHHSKH